MFLHVWLIVSREWSVYVADVCCDRTKRSRCPNYCSAVKMLSLTRSQSVFLSLIDATHIVCGVGSMQQSIVHLSVCWLVCLFHRSQQQRGRWICC